ncbi:MAG: argininosuccinate lyase, partial [Bacillota bacterium]
MKLWGGRFTERTDKLVDDFNASLDFDRRLAEYDLRGSKAHVKMLGKTGIIEKSEAEEIVRGLEEIEKELAAGELEITGAEDIHSFMEGLLTEKVGKIGGKLHTARSRNDQVALDLRLYLRDQLDMIQSLLEELMQTLLSLAEEHKATIMPGFTHLQPAQPITFGHHLMAYYFKFKRDYERLQDNRQRINVLPLGSGALAGTSFPIDRELVAEELGFDRVCQNSLDGVSDRDFVLEFLGVAANMMMHFSRLSEEVILWSSSGLNFIRLADTHTTGSSIMPQKKNPDVAELVRGKTGRVYGHLMQLLTAMKGLPLAYNKDMQEDKEGLFDTIDTLTQVLNIYPDMLSSMEVNEEQMQATATTGYTNATELANYLVRQGLTFRKAHEIVGKAVLYCLDEDKGLEEMEPREWKELVPEIAELVEENLSRVLQVENCVAG